MQLNGASAQRLVNVLTFQADLEECDVQILAGDDADLHVVKIFIC